MTSLIRSDRAARRTPPRRPVVPHSLSMRTSTRLAALGALTLALAGCTGTLPAGPEDTTAPPASSSTTTTSAPAPVTTTPAPPPAPPAAGQIGDGNFIAGTITDYWAASQTAQVQQIAAGTYQTVADVSPGCYWWITDASLPAEDMLDYGASYGSPDDGRPTVEIVNGDHWQVFQCGAWERVS